MGLSIEFNVLPEEYNQKIGKTNRGHLKEMWIALAGPATNILIMMVARILKTSIDNVLYLEILYSNLLIAVFNLLPIYPLDGGRIIKEAVYMAKGRKKAMELTNYLSNVSMILLTMLSSVAIYYYKNIAILFIIAYLWSIVIIENRKYHLKKRIHKIIENG